MTYHPFDTLDAAKSFIADGMSVELAETVARSISSSRNSDMRHFATKADLMEVKEEVMELKGQILEAKVEIAETKAEVHRVEGTLTAEVHRVEGTLTAEVHRVEGTLTAEVHRVEDALTAEVHRVESTLTGRMTTEIHKAKNQVLFWVITSMISLACLCISGVVGFGLWILQYIAQ